MFIGTRRIEMVGIDVKDEFSTLPSLISSNWYVVECCRMIDTVRSNLD
jgi:hypothetical protein